MRELLKNRKFVSFSLGLLVFVVLGAFAIHLLSSERGELKRLKEQQKEMRALRQEFLSLKQRVGAVENRKNLSTAEGIIQAVDTVFSSLGLKDRLKTVKSSGLREVKEGVEEEADIYVEKITMNEMVNIFYSIENSPMVLTIKKAAIKKSFDNPELLNVSLTLSFFKAK